MANKQEKPNRFNELIEIEGLQDNSTLIFNFKPNQLMQTTLSLRNISKNKLIYKFKTTNPRCYSVQPNQKEIHPNSEVIVEFTLQPRQEFKEGLIGDKFMIDVAELTEQIVKIILETSKQVEDLLVEDDTNKILKQYVQGTKKIEVALSNNKQQVDRSIDYTKGSISQRDTSKFIYLQQIQSLLSSSKLFTSMGLQNEEDKRLQDSLKKALEENKLLNQQNKELEKKIKDLQKIQQANTQEANFTLFHVIIIAIISLIAGAFLTK